MQKDMDVYAEFLSRFSFRPDLAGHIGVERERFLVTPMGVLVPRAKDFLDLMDSPAWTYELSACQVEDRTLPLGNLNQIKEAMFENDKQGREVAKKLGLILKTIEVADANMPLDVYPEKRYARIRDSITPERLSAACRVTAAQFHIGMPDLKAAIETVNVLREHIPALCKLGDHSKGERLKLYKVMAPNYETPCYKSVQHFFQVACTEGFDLVPRDCWHLIRISRHGTVELRMFGATDNIEEICGWISYVRALLPKSVMTTSSLV